MTDDVIDRLVEEAIQRDSTAIDINWAVRRIKELCDGNIPVGMLTRVANAFRARRDNPR